MAAQANEPARPSRRSMLAAAGLPALVAIAVYVNTLGGGFVHDDGQQIVRNPWVHDLHALPSALTEPVWAFRTTAAAHYYRPLQMGLYNVLWNAGGASPLPFHLFNVVLHAMVTAATALMVLRFSRDGHAAAAAGLLFAVHPIHTEAVAWIASLPELLFVLFLLLAFLSHSRGSRAWASASYALALLSKETAITMLGLVFLYELWRQPRRPGKAALTRAVRALLPYLGVTAGWIALRWTVVGGFGAVRATPHTWIDAIVNAPALLAGHLRLILWPFPLIAQRVVDPVPAPLALAVLVIAACATLIVVAGLRLAKSRPDLALALALLLLPLLPALYLPGIGSTWLAERYSYLPSAGLVWLVAAGLPTLLSRSLGARGAGRAVLLLAILIAVPASLWTWRRNLDWRSDFHLATATLRDEPRAEPMYVLLGNWHEAHSQPELALATYARGRSVLPDSTMLKVSHLNLSFRMGKISPQEAADAYERLDLSGIDLYEVHAIVGEANLHARRFSAAERAYVRALELNPHEPMLYNKLAVVYVETGRVDAAIETLERALAIDPDFSLARENLAHIRGTSP